MVKRTSSQQHPRSRASTRVPHRPTTRARYVPRYVQRKVQHSLIYLFLFTVLLSLAIGLYKGGVHLAQLKSDAITIRELPAALTLSFLRMLGSYIASLFFAYFFGLLAARSKFWERMIIPLLDILQAMPVVVFFPAAISLFIGLGNGHRISIEMAAIFLIFTSQAWNMAFAVYEAVKTIPQDNIDAVESFGVHGSQKFWELYAPASVPRLVYNSILSWTNGWFFLVACEIIAVGPIQFNLPGIGSFLARAAEQDKIGLVLWGTLALVVFVLMMDIFLWRPLSQWAERFKQDYTTVIEPDWRSKSSPFFTALEKLDPLRDSLVNGLSRMLRILTVPFFWILKDIVLPLIWDLPSAIITGASREVYLRFALPALFKWNRTIQRVKWLNFILLWALGLTLGLFTGRLLLKALSPPWPSIAREIPLALLLSTLRLVVALGISLAWILPLTLYAWNKPKLRVLLNTLAQVGASVPAIALFPLIVLVAVGRLGGGMEISSLILLITGMQWYLLFNGLGGLATIPGDLAEATRSFGLTRFQTWRLLVLPALRPALITGAITAWGGGWNALVVAEYVKFKGHVLVVNGIGALISRSVYELGDHKAITLCVAAMVGWIIIVNTLFWRPLYHSASERYKFDS